MVRWLSLHEVSMLIDVTKEELEYIVTALWKCRKTEGEPKCVQVYDKLKPLLEVCTCKED
mgnify:FL=1